MTVGFKADSSITRARRYSAK
jgi:hypothetical protein